MNLRGGGVRGAAGLAEGDVPADDTFEEQKAKMDEYIELMRKCAKSVGEGSADIPDGYLLLKQMKEQGLRPTLQIYNELLLVCVEAAKSGRACTADV